MASPFPSTRTRKHYGPVNDRLCYGVRPKNKDKEHFAKSGSEGPCILLRGLSLRHFIFLLINSDLPQKGDIFLEGYDIQSLPLIHTHSLL